MKTKLNVKKCAFAVAMSVSIVVPQIPHFAHAEAATIVFPIDLFPEDKNSDTGLSPTSPVIPNTDNNGNSGNNGNNGNNQNRRTGLGQQGSNRSSTSSSSSSSTTTTVQKPTMKVATVPDEYACPLFENKPHAELIQAINSLTKEVRTTPECSNDASAKAIETNSKTLQDNITAIQKMMTASNTMQVDSNQIDQTVTGALQAVGNLGSVINNNNFLNSKCGKQTMSTGKVLLALNDVINGLAPYALFAVSMNAALAPALPFVIGGAVATSGISAIAKMIDNNTLDMTVPEHRKALLQNTCQFTKVAKKVRFMQLAQSGKIEKITQELEKDVDLYKANFGQPSRELLSLLNYRQVKVKSYTEITNQLASDTTDFDTINAQITENGDDLMICTLAQELVNWGQDGTSFPASAFTNLDTATKDGDKSQRLQAVTLKSLNATSVKRISETAPKASEDDQSLKACAQSGRSWIKGIRQALVSTSAVLQTNQVVLENELSQNTEYRSWKAAYNKIQTQRVTINRVQKAMEELAKDNSIIDRSELAQSITILKAGLFGSRSSWSFGRPPVLAWIYHTKSMHDQSISAYVTGLKAIRDGAFSFTDTGKGKNLVMGPANIMMPDQKQLTADNKKKETLETINLTNLPVGSRENEIACQQLESAYLDWSASLDHLGAIQFFCDLIDPVLDVKMDTSIVRACRGTVELSGRKTALSTVESAKQTLVSKGYQTDAALISKKMKELKCPTPPVSVMNN